MPVKVPPFKLYFEVLFLESYSELGPRERKSVDKGIKLMADNPRHPSLNVHKAKNVNAKYSVGGMMFLLPMPPGAFDLHSNMVLNPG